MVVNRGLRDSSEATGMMLKGILAGVKLGGKGGVTEEDAMCLLPQEEQKKWKRKD